MSNVRFPAPLKPGDVVGVTSPSAGVATKHHGRLDAAISDIRDQGFDVRVGECMGDDGITSAPAPQRAAELTAMLCDPSVRAIVPPWGGETAIDLISLLDFDTIADAEPTWVVGYSDMSTLITPLTLRTGVATIHGNNLMDTPYTPADGTVNWLDIVTHPTGEPLVQTSVGAYRSKDAGWPPYELPADQTPRDLGLDSQSPWRVINPDGTTRTGGIELHGRLIGGCTETLCNLAGTPYLDVATWRDTYTGGDDLIVYVEAAGDDAGTICRNLHGMRLAGFFNHARGVLIGRTHAPASGAFTQDDAVLDALGPLGVPLVLDVDCGHVAPYLPLVNGASAVVNVADGSATVTQHLT